MRNTVKKFISEAPVHALLKQEAGAETLNSDFLLFFQCLSDNRKEIGKVTWGFLNSSG